MRGPQFHPARARSKFEWRIFIKRNTSPRSRQPKKETHRYAVDFIFRVTLTRLGEQFLYAFLRLSICAFTDMGKSNATALVNQIHRWPCPGIVPFPIREIIVERNRIRNIEATDSLPDIRRFMLIIEFGRVYSDNDKTAAGVSIVPLPQTRQFVSTIDSAERPKLDQHNLAAQIVPI